MVLTAPYTYNWITMEDANEVLVSAAEFIKGNVFHAIAGLESIFKDYRKKNGSYVQLYSLVTSL